LFLPNNLTTFEFYLRDGSGMSSCSPQTIAWDFPGIFLDFFLKKRLLAAEYGCV